MRSRAKAELSFLEEKFESVKAVNSFVNVQTQGKQLPSQSERASILSQEKESARLRAVSSQNSIIKLKPVEVEKENGNFMQALGFDKDQNPITELGNIVDDATFNWFWQSYTDEVIE